MVKNEKVRKESLQKDRSQNKESIVNSQWKEWGRYRRYISKGCSLRKEKIDWQVTNSVIFDNIKNATVTIYI